MAFHMNAGARSPVGLPAVDVGELTLRLFAEGEASESVRLSCSLQSQVRLGGLCRPSAPTKLHLPSLAAKAQPNRRNLANYADSAAFDNRILPAARANTPKA